MRAISTTTTPVGRRGARSLVPMASRGLPAPRGSPLTLHADSLRSGQLIRGAPDDVSTRGGRAGDSAARAERAARTAGRCAVHPACMPRARRLLATPAHCRAVKARAPHSFARRRRRRKRRAPGAWRTCLSAQRSSARSRARASCHPPRAPAGRSQASPPRCGAPCRGRGGWPKPPRGPPPTPLLPPPPGTVPLAPLCALTSP
jgi:hypothetical protein